MGGETPTRVSPYQWDPKVEDFFDTSYYQTNGVGSELKARCDDILKVFSTTEVLFRAICENKGAQFTVHGNLDVSGHPMRSQVVFEHAALPGWIFKMKNPDKTDSFPEEVRASGLENHQSALRVAFAKRMRTWVTVRGLSSKILIPETSLYTFQNAQSYDDDTSLTVCEKVKDFIHGPEGMLYTARNISELSVRECEHLANLLCQFVAGTGFMDGHFFNIQFNERGQVTVIDAHPERTTEVYFTDHDPVSDRNGALLSRAAKVEECLNTGFERLCHNLVRSSKEIFMQKVQEYTRFTSEQHRLIAAKQTKTEAKLARSIPS